MVCINKRARISKLSVDEAVCFWNFKKFVVYTNCREVFF